MDTGNTRTASEQNAEFPMPAKDTLPVVDIRLWAEDVIAAQIGPRHALGQQAPLCLP